MPSNDPPWVTPDEVKWAREYWGALSDDELDAFWKHATQKGHHSYWTGVDENTTYNEYLIISARQSDYERKHDI